MQTSAAAPRLGGSLADALTAAGPPLLFGLRMWASVCLALFVAFSLELDNPFWAGTTAAIVCQPQLGASLRKGWFRMIGTAIGATMIVVLTACFPQNRIGFLALLALWGGLCVFAASVLRNFASYAASLAGYTAVIIAADVLGPTGGPSDQVFLLAVWRSSEIGIGIVCAGVILAGTDLGGATRRLATAFADMVNEIASGLTRMLALTGPDLAGMQAQRRELVRRVIALEPTVDQTLGESSQVRYYATTLQDAVNGLLKALDGWRGVVAHQIRRHAEIDQRERETILRSIPPELKAGRERASPTRWMSDPVAQRRFCEEGIRTLLALPTRSPSLRLLADETAKVLVGLSHALDGLALLVDAPGHRHPGPVRFWPDVPDWLPPFVHAIRACITIVAAELFWVITGWPNGASAIIFVAIVILLLSPKGDLAYLGSLGLALGVAGAVVCAAIIKFAVLPQLYTFPAFCLAIGLFYVPVGFAFARARRPAAMVVAMGMGANFMPLLSPTNQMSYDTAQFYNMALSIIVGCGVAPIAFRLLPPPSPALRTRRLLGLTLHDLRRLALDPLSWTSEAWETRMFGRLAALPDQAEPIERVRLLAALSVGAEIIQLHRIAPSLDMARDLDAALQAFALGHSAAAVSQLRELDRRLDLDSAAAPAPVIAISARARLLAVGEALVLHASYFDTEASA